MILREIKIRWKSLLFWAIGFAFMIIGGMTKFDTFSAGGSQDLNQFIQSMPRIMRIIYGMEGIDISTFTGYFGLLLLYVLIMASIHGAFLGASLIHQEFKDRTADFLFVKPMSRDHILLRKLGSGLVMILILEAVIAACCFYVFNESGQLPCSAKRWLQPLRLMCSFSDWASCSRFFCQSPARDSSSPWSSFWSATCPSACPSFMISPGSETCLPSAGITPGSISPAPVNCGWPEGSC